ncbi:heavy metal translocating P-type ATPase [Parenemella sanctibonifatiensis]|uniref:Copper-translocating P-type ATPase n=1 Tax=Parenemella sanctibonifatiensis TaxID=2016505 RepID=A0A255EAE9_9ACTN|nr:heavy metal translocating P-type ATPase [Parenemella sanctibonifatiensis]OYN86475.1 copper-translocating P-type ATPase [Parenemella sanctibonifatiensis]
MTSQRTDASTEVTDEAPEAFDEPLQLAIGGMTCAACANRVEKKLNKMPGVRATVNYATERAIVRGLPADRIAEAEAVVSKAGYHAAPVGSDDQEEFSERRVRSLKLRLIVAAVLSVPLGNLAIVLALVPELRFTGWQLLCLLLAVPVVFWCAWPFHKATFRNLQQRSFSMDTLVSLGVLAAFSWSLISLLWGGDDTEGYWLGYGITPAGADAIYLEVAAAVTTFLLAGRYFEARSRRSAQDVLNALNLLGVDRVRIRRDETVVTVPLAEVRIGDVAVVRAGERVPVDGTVVAGSGPIDTSMMSGEPLPREVSPGDAVIGGTVNLTALLEVRTDRVGAHTQLAQMAAMAEQAQARKARVQLLVDKVVSVFVPVVLVIALGTLVGWLLADAGVRHAASAAMSVLIIACPCALGLATPTALMVGVGRGSQLGILIKGPDALEASGRVDTVVLDKTGTLTHGSLSVVDAWHADPDRAETIDQLVGSVEEGSEHPIARALAVDQPDPTGEVEALPGLGVRGRVTTAEGSLAVVVGSPTLVSEQFELGAAGEIIDRFASQGHTVAVAVVEGQVAAAYAIADRLRDEAVAVVSELRRRGLRTILLTGDGQVTAEAVGAQLGVDQVIAEVLPTDKATVIEGLQADGHQVAMVGDGINDAAALAAAELGMAVVSGTDIALRSADVVLVRRNLWVVVDALRLSRKTLRVIRGNLLWAFGYNVAAIPLAAAGLLNPLIAGLAMSLSSVLVVTNSLRLRNFESATP